MVNTDNAKSKCEFKKFTQSMGNKQDGCAIKSLEAPDFKRNTSACYALPSIVNSLLKTSFNINSPCRALAYKKVENKVKPVATTMLAHAHIIRRFPEDPLASLPPLSPNLPDFSPGKRLTQEWMNELSIFANEFLLTEE
jgi:hypothetical protein